MKLDPLTIIEMAGIIGLAFSFVGIVVLLVGVRKARREFRVKGFLRTPAGVRWFRFLLWKQYDHFEDSGTRFFFGIAHFCLMGVIVVITAILVLLGSELLLGGVAGLPAGMFGQPSLPK